MTQPAIELHNVSKRFIICHEKARSFQDALVHLVHRRNGTKEEFWALHDVSFQVERGETLGIVGRNGSGKSTILKLVTRILKPTAGTLAVNGRVSALIELGAGFHPDLTGRENIFLNGSILGLSRKTMRSRFDDIVAFAELERFIDTPVRHYSSGMYARLGFAVAVNVEPDILIIDEVLSVGDEAFQSKCLSKIREFQTRGVTIVVVSHSLDVVLELCDRAVWLSSGLIKLTGGAAEVVEGYLGQAHADGRALAEEEGTEPGLRRASGGRRWGSGEVQITRVQLLDGDGRERCWLASGDCLVVRMHYRTDCRIARPVFAVVLHTTSGVQLTALNRSAPGGIEAVWGDGWVDCRIEALPLTAGAYELSVAAYDDSGTHAFDYQHRMYAFDVRRGTLSAERGLIHIPCEWRHLPAGAEARPPALGVRLRAETTN